jgi:lipoprotein signal peptidase
VDITKSEHAGQKSSGALWCEHSAVVFNISDYGILTGYMLLCATDVQRRSRKGDSCSICTDLSI